MRDRYRQRTVKYISRPVAPISAPDNPRPQKTGLARIVFRQSALICMVLVLFGGLIFPLTEQRISESRYMISAKTDSILGTVPENLAAKLNYDAKAKAYNYESPSTEENSNKVSSGNYSAALPEDSSQGISVTDAGSNIGLTIKPDFKTLAGKKVGGRVIYPSLEKSAQLVYTLKGNGLKEDVVVPQYIGDKLSFAFTMSIPVGTAARLLDDGSIGVYAGDSKLFGNISFGTDTDRDLVDKAREKSEKTQLVFTIPAPIIKDATGQESTNNVRYELADKGITEPPKTPQTDAPVPPQAKTRSYTLNVKASQLKNLAYPLSIDPTLVVTSASDIQKGDHEGNIDSSFDSIKRAALTGGGITPSGTGTWTTQTLGSMSSRYSHSTAVYNGRIYVLGGCTATGASCGTYSSEVWFAAINISTGALGTWTATSSFTTARAHHATVVHNGYLYVIGGSDAGGVLTGTSRSLYARINDQTGILDPPRSGAGCASNWCETANAPATSRHKHSAVVSNGHIFILGGISSVAAAVQSSVERAVFRGDGDMGAFSAGNSFTTERHSMGAAVYNNYIYISGGYTGASYLSDVQYVLIGTDGAMGSWVSMSSSTYGALPATTAGHAMVASRGYVYILGGGVGAVARSTVYFAQINGDGSLGSWITTTDISGGTIGARSLTQAVFYNDYIYAVTGCTNETSTCSTLASNAIYAKVAPGGSSVNKFNSNTNALAQRYQHAATTYNGYLYISGGRVASGDFLDTIIYFKINANGTLSDQATATEVLPLIGIELGGRSRHAMLAVKGRLYIIGGEAETTAGGGTSVSSDKVMSAPINATGNIDNNSITSGFTTDHPVAPVTTETAAFYYRDAIYVAGGDGATTSFQKLSVTSEGLPSGGWGNAGSGSSLLPAERTGTKALIYDDYVYLVGGKSAGSVVAVTYTGTFNNSGIVTSWAETGSLTTGRYGHEAFIYKGYVFAMGGCGIASSSCPAGNLLSSVEFSDIASTGELGWGAIATTLPVAVAGQAGVIVNGWTYLSGGCTSGCTVVEDDIYDANVGNGGISGANWLGNFAGSAAVVQKSAAVAYKGRIYISGGANATGTLGEGVREVSFGTITDIGNITSWTTDAANQLPTSPEAACNTLGLFAHGMVAYNDELFVIGGASSSGTACQAGYKTYRTSLDANGNIMAPTNCPTANIGVWCTQKDLGFNGVSGSVQRSHAAILLYNNYLMVIGGRDGNGTTLGNYFFTTLNTVNPPTAGHYIQNWTTVTTNNLPSARELMAATQYSGYIYLFGGTTAADTTSTTILDDALYAKINTADVTDLLDVPNNCTKSSSQWCYGPPLQAKVVSAVAIADHGSVVLAGGFTAQVTALSGTYTTTIRSTEQTWTAPVYADGLTGGWATTGKLLTTPRGNAASAYSGGKFYIVKGLNAAGTRLSTLEYSSLWQVVRKGIYKRTFDAGVNVDVLARKLITNGTVGSNVGLTHRQATAATPSIWAFTNPSNFTLGSLYTFTIGYNQSVQIIYTLDDSQNATYPENASQYSEITDFSYFFSPNAGKRLRGGKTFTNEQQRGLEATPQ